MACRGSRSLGTLPPSLLVIVPHVIPLVRRVSFLFSRDPGHNAERTLNGQNHRCGEEAIVRLSMRLSPSLPPSLSPLHSRFWGPSHSRLVDIPQHSTNQPPKVCNKTTAAGGRGVSNGHFHFHHRNLPIVSAPCMPGTGFVPSSQSVPEYQVSPTVVASGENIRVTNGDTVRSIAGSKLRPRPNT
jgi:hypothetical protein